MSRNIPFNPYEGFSSQRQEQLNNYARQLLDKNAGGGINFAEFGSMLNELSATGLNTNEKCNVWTTVAGLKNNYAISNVGLISNNIDTFRPDTSAGHVVIGFNDGYHCPLANLPLNEADQKILEHEQTEGGWAGGIGRTILGTINRTGSLNLGDIQASQNQVRALKKFLEGGFAAYAREWNTRFLGR